MIRQGSGSIINTGSIAGLRAGLFGPQLFRRQGRGHPRHALRRRRARGEGYPRQQHLPGAIVTGIFAKVAGLPTRSPSAPPTA